MWQWLLFPFLVLIGACASAHEDLDIGIESVRLNQECFTEVTLKNYGRPLPSSFYLSPKNAYVSIEKSSNVESLERLSALDKQRDLQKTGGRLVVISRHVYASIPEPIKVKLNFQGEFYDHGGKNNSWQESMDCVVGQGQIAGKSIAIVQPDLAVLSAEINSTSCKLEATFQNLTAIPLQEDAWSEVSGVFLMQLNLDTQERLEDVALSLIDPKRVFSRKGSVVQWQSQQAYRDMHMVRIALWRVKGDLNFDNNYLELKVPEACR